MKQWHCALEVSNAAAGSWTSWRQDTRQKPEARQAGEEQCLGDMTWVRPGDCNRARHGLLYEGDRAASQRSHRQPDLRALEIALPVGRIGVERRPREDRLQFGASREVSLFERRT